MNTLILIGIIMTISGIAVWIFGQIRGVPNTWLWALFPIIHGLHEFAEYILEELNGNFIIERFELLFAFSSSLVLLAACIEYTGGFTKPSGKIAALGGLSFILYIIFIIPEEIIEDMEHFTINFGILQSDPFRFFYGFVLVIISAILLLSSYYSLEYKSKKNSNFNIDEKLKKISITATILLIIFAIFEGFNSENSIFITLRAISLAFFIIIPVVVIFTTKIGIQNLLVIKNTGALLYGYNFSKKKDMFSLSDEEQTAAILAAGFLSAISGFSNDVLKAGSSFTIRSNSLYFILYKEGELLYTIQSINTNKKLETSFVHFIKEIHENVKNNNQPGDTDKKIAEKIIHNNFIGLY